MTLLFLNGLPPRTSNGAILRLLIEAGGIARDQVGKIDIKGRQATVEVPTEWGTRLMQALDGVEFNHRNLQAWQQDGVQAGSVDDDHHFGHLLRLMQIEAQAEAQQMRERRQRFSGADAEQTGQTLVGLVSRGEDAGLGGRVLLTLGKRNRTQPLPWTRLRVGTPVLLNEEDVTDGPSWRGVVSQQRADSIQVAFEKWPELSDDKATLRLDVANDEIAHRRERAALQQVQAAKGNRLAELRKILLGQQEPLFRATEDFTPLATTLNEAQLAAVQLTLQAEDVSIIHGPPGTGKTTTVVEVIRQAVRRGEKVLACAPSNMAVDNIFERLLAAGENVLRLGHPARVLPELRAYTLDEQVERDPDVRNARKLVREAYQLRDKASRFTRAKPEKGAKQEMRQEAKQMLADARRMEAQAVARIIDGVDIICATTTGLNSELLGQRQFDLGVIDEAAQSTEPGSWIPILRSQRLVLAGDHCQLPPTIVSPEAEKQGLGLSLMERLMTQNDATISHQLTRQYRMHRDIMRFSSTEFYDETLQADTSVEAHRLSDLPDIQSNDLTDTAVTFIDTAGASFDEEVDPNGESRLNPQEAQLAGQKVNQLLEAGVSAEAIAVITPYAAQARLMQEQINISGLEIDSVDGFQGREKEVVIISLVRSNEAGDIGFLADTRRLNVALTRARRKLLVIGDSATITTDPFYQRLVDYFEQIQAYRSVWEEMEW